MVGYYFDRDCVNLVEPLVRNDSTAQGGVYMILVDDYVVYVNKAKCLSRSIARDIVGIANPCVALHPDLDMYDCLNYWDETGHSMYVKCWTDTNIKNGHGPITVESDHMAAYEKDPLATIKAELILCFRPVLNPPVRIIADQIYNDNLDLKQQLLNSDINWIREAITIKPKHKY